LRPGRWWNVILPMGLLMALSPLSAQAGPNRPVAQQSNRQAVTCPQPRGNAYGGNNQVHQWQPPRGNAYGWNGQNRQWQQPRGNSYGWNNQPHQWQQPHGNAYGGNNYQRQWDQHRNEYGWNNQPHQWQQPRGNTYGWNDHQNQGQQPRNAIAQGERPVNQQVQPSNWGQHMTPGSAYNRAGYPAQGQYPQITPSASGYHHNGTMPAGQTGVPSGSAPANPGNTPQPISQSPAGAI
jgi:hypothetical protein